MKKIILYSTVCVLLMGCGGDDSSSAAKKNVMSFKAIESKPTTHMPLNTVQDIHAVVHYLEQNQKKYDRTFKYFYDHMKVINQQLPKLNSVLQSQLQQLMNNKNEMVLQVHKILDNQFDSLNDDLNAFGKELAKKGY